MDAELLDQMRETMVGRAGAAPADLDDTADLIEAPQPSPYDKLSDNLDDPFGELVLSAPIPVAPSPEPATTAVVDTASTMMDAAEAARAAAEAEAEAHCEPESEAPDSSITVDDVVVSSSAISQNVSTTDAPADATDAMAQNMADRMADRMIDDARETLDALAADDTTALARLEDGLDAWDRDALTDPVDIAAPVDNVNVLLTDEDPALSLDIFD